VNYLLDVNVPAAWGWSDHVDHERTAAWIGVLRRRKAAKLMTSAIPELGFVRVSVQRTGGRVTVAEAAETLASMVDALGASARPARRRSGRASISGMVFCCIAYNRCPPSEAGRSTRSKAGHARHRDPGRLSHSPKVARGG
jgi:hypothetical protein